MSILEWFFAVLAALLVLYVAVRVAATAWFRTRRDHAHRLMREMKEGNDDNG